VAVCVEKFEKLSFRRRKKTESPVQPRQTAAEVQREFEIRRPRDEPLVDGFQVLGDAATPPVITNGVVNDFHEQSLWLSDIAEAAKGRDCVQGNLLFEIFIANRRACSFRGEMKHGANLRDVEFHVTVLQVVRL
jgi:hypothetical protein